MSRPITSLLLSLCSLCLCGSTAFADPPVASYIFPAGGQRGTKVKVRVGGLDLHDRCNWELVGPGVTASKHLARIKTLWFEGPILPLPDSQRQEDYPQDMAGEVSVARDAALGVRRGRVWTSEGAHPGIAFMVGDLPELVEDEVEGDPAPLEVKLPVTINGRIFPREDIDAWSFAARKGQAFACEVHAARLGSPLDARLEVRGPDGKVVAENDDARGADSFLTFTAPADGKYEVRIHDSQRGGSQRHVYRLTISDGPYVAHVFPLGGRKGTRTRFTLQGANVPAGAVEAALDGGTGERLQSFAVNGKATNAVPVEVDDLPEFVEAKPRDGAKGLKAEVGGVANGRIDGPGDADLWRFVAKKGQAIDLTLAASRLGSPLSGVVELLDDAEKVIARSTPGDSSFLFTAPRDGTFTARVRDQFRTRGGPAFAYRLRITEARPDFRMELAASAHHAARGGQGNLRLKVVRTGGFNGPVALTFAGLPAGVKVAPSTVNAGQPQVELSFSAGKDAALGTSRITVKGTATLAGKPAERVARLEASPGEQPVEDVLFAVALKAPFKVVGVYDLRLAPRGTVFRKKFKVERNGFTGPLEVRLADRQSRHLQGVTGPTFTVPGDVSEFEYPVTLPPWMETGRTSRACVMATGKVKVDGVEHTVSYTSQEQNNQIIAVVETGQLALELGRSSVAVKPGASVEVPVSVRRGKGLNGAVKVELVAQAAASAEAVTIAADKTAGVLKVKFGQKPPAGPLLVRATVETKTGPVVAEAKVEAVGE